MSITSITNIEIIVSELLFIKIIDIIISNITIITIIIITIYIYITKFIRLSLITNQPKLYEQSNKTNQEKDK